MCYHEKGNEVLLSFCVWGFNNITQQEITDTLDIPPSMIHMMGEKMNPKADGLAKENGWFLDAYKGDFEERLNYRR